MPPCTGQRGADRGEAQALERRARHQQHGESDQGDDQRPALDAPVSPERDVAGERHPPVGRDAEQVEKQVRDPGTDHAAGVAHHAAGRAVGPARVVAVEGDEDQQQVDGEREQHQPLRFAQQTNELRRQRSAGFVRRGQDPYSGSMMVSRRWWPRLVPCTRRSAGPSSPGSPSRARRDHLAMSCRGRLVTIFSPSRFPPCRAAGGRPGRRRRAAPGCRSCGRPARAPHRAAHHCLTSRSSRPCTS